MNNETVEVKKGPKSVRRDKREQVDKMWQEVKPQPPPDKITVHTIGLGLSGPKKNVSVELTTTKKGS